MPVAPSRMPEVHASGEIRLPATLPGGGYAVELVVFDSAWKNQRSATQWTDFTLTQPTPASKY